MLLRQRDGFEPDVLHSVRLAFLIYPLMDELEPSLGDYPVALALGRFLAGQRAEPPGEVDLNLLAALRDDGDLKDQTIWLVHAGVRRIKRYVFETPGLNEIRGASTLLDNLTFEAKEAIAKELGPEVILRAVGSSLLFMVPTEKEAQGWHDRILKVFHQATGTAFAVAYKTKVIVDELRRNYEKIAARLDSGAEQNRFSSEPPAHELLPFEAFCEICHQRPAEGWFTSADGDFRAACRPCHTKRKVGTGERRLKSKSLLDRLGLGDPEKLGVKGAHPGDYVAKGLGSSEPPEYGFIPSGKSHLLNATIYGDGNNFGAIGKRLKSIADARQWTQRVEKTTTAATAYALARSTQETAQDNGWNPSDPDPKKLPRLPFQVLALGGDDLSLFAWAPVGARFIRYFLEAADPEFRKAGNAEHAITDRHIAFSLGMLVTDCKAPVRRTVAFTENELLKWAKQAFRESELMNGNVAMLLAATQEQIPDDLKRYRKQVYENKSDPMTLYLTLRPFSGDELEWVLNKAHALRDHSGPLHRMVSAFVRKSPHAALSLSVRTVQRGSQILAEAAGGWS